MHQTLSILFNLVNSGIYRRILLTAPCLEICRRGWIIHQLIAALQQPSAAVLRSPPLPLFQIRNLSIHPSPPPALVSPPPALSSVSPEYKKASIFNIRTAMICVYGRGFSPVVITIAPAVRRCKARARGVGGCYRFLVQTKGFGKNLDIPNKLTNQEVNKIFFLKKWKIWLG